MAGFRALHFGMMHMLTSLISQNLFGNFSYTIRHGLAVGMRCKGGLGFLPIKSPETPETQFLREMPLEGRVVYDVGAFEGVLTLYFARRARQVVAYEPNPRNYDRCLQNVRLNGLENVQVMNRGISDARGLIELVYDPLMPGAGSGEAAIIQQIKSTVRSARKVSVPVLSLDDEIAENGLPLPDIVKIDIEGMELHALKGMKGTLAEQRPNLFIEMHGATRQEKIENAQAVVGLLESFQYRILDIEARRYLKAATLGEQRPGHIWCTPE
jgi:FkbM family methyltransferase